MNIFGLLLVLAPIVMTVSAERKCGEIFNSTHNVLQNLEFPYSMKPTEKCFWQFNVSESFVYLNLETVDLTENDFVNISDGVSVYNYTGIKVPQQQTYILSPNNSQVNVTISPDQSSDTTKRFKAEYIAGSNTTFFVNDVMGIIKSPKYSLQNATASISWTITYKPEKNIYLAFKFLNISDGSNLTIDDGESPKYFTGHTLPDDIVNFASSIIITLTLNCNAPEQRFELFYSYLYPNCSSEIKLTNKTEEYIDFNITIKEPHVELPIQCYIIVVGPENSVLSVSIDWKDNSLNDSANAVIALGDGGSRFSPLLLVDSLTNRRKTSNVITKANKLWIGYSSFQEMDALVKVVVHNQGGYLFHNGSFGIETLPLNTSLSSNTSAFILNSLPGEQVIVNISSNTTLHGQNKILFYDGGSRDHLIMEFNSNNTLFFPVTSSKHQMMIIAENFKNNETFEATFVGALKGYHQLSTNRFGSFDIVDIMANGSRCWIIAPTYNSSELIAITINDAKLSSDLVLQIYEGTSNTSKLIYELKNCSINSLIVHSLSAKGAMITLRNDGIATEGLIADISFEILPVCNYTLDLNVTKSAVIRSPNYPNSYPLNANCHWRINSNKFIQFNFKYFDIPSAHSLQFYNNESKILHNVSGDIAVDDIIITESQVFINWSSPLFVNNLTHFKGFEIEIHQIDCGGSLTVNDNTFTTPGFPSNVKNSTLCVWSLSTPTNGTEIIKLSYTSQAVPSSSAKMTIYEGGSLKSVEANVSLTTETDFLSRTNKLMILYNYTADKYDGTPYSFTSKVYPCTAMCQNGLCLHDSWRCNNQNDCGDNSDEIDCVASPIVESSGGVSVTALVVSMLLCLTIGAVGAMSAPFVWRKIRSHGRNYQEFRNSVDA